MSSKYSETGQHCATPGPQPNNGQRQMKDRGVVVGQQSGGEQAMLVPACPASKLVDTTTGPKG